MNRYDTIGRRFGALLIDLVVFLPLIILAVVLAEREMPLPLEIAWLLVSYLSNVAYSVLLHWKYGRTIGKMVVKVRVLDLSDGPITLWQAFLRDIPYVVQSAVGIGSVAVMMVLGYSKTSEQVIQIEGYFMFPVFAWFLTDTIVCLTNPQRRALHDIIAGTVVVRSDVFVETEARLVEPPGPHLYGEFDGK